mmetsp:Transcript_20493/g.60620  ORF Transcript_20493/g.60620 Transcript_20493/m.60620 type:complete len:680 (-) Transcript_20493:798-2837(-)
MFPPPHGQRRAEQPPAKLAGQVVLAGRGGWGSRHVGTVPDAPRGQPRPRAQRRVLPDRGRAAGGPQVRAARGLRPDGPGGPRVPRQALRPPAAAAHHRCRQPRAQPRHHRRALQRLRHRHARRLPAGAHRKDRRPCCRLGRRGEHRGERRQLPHRRPRAALRPLQRVRPGRPARRVHLPPRVAVVLAQPPGGGAVRHAAGAVLHALLLHRRQLRQPLQRHRVGQDGRPAAHLLGGEAAVQAARGRLCLARPHLHPAGRVDGRGARGAPHAPLLRPPANAARRAPLPVSPQPAVQPGRAARLQPHPGLARRHRHHHRHRLWRPLRRLPVRRHQPARHHQPAESARPHREDPLPGQGHLRPRPRRPHQVAHRAVAARLPGDERSVCGRGRGRRFGDRGAVPLAVGAGRVRVAAEAGGRAHRHPPRPRRASPAPARRRRRRAADADAAARRRLAAHALHRARRRACGHRGAGLLRAAVNGRQGRCAGRDQEDGRRARRIAPLRRVPQRALPHAARQAGGGAVQDDDLDAGRPPCLDRQGGRGALRPGRECAHAPAGQAVDAARACALLPFAGERRGRGAPLGEPGAAGGAARGGHLGGLRGRERGGPRGQAAAHQRRQLPGAAGAARLRPCAARDRRRRGGAARGGEDGPGGEGGLPPGAACGWGRGPGPVRPSPPHATHAH